MEIIWFNKKKGFGLIKMGDKNKIIHKKEIKDLKNKKLNKGEIIELKDEIEWDII